MVVVRERSDARLLELAGEGDRDAFAELYGRLGRAVYSLCLRTLGDRGRAEDAAQEAFSAIWRSAGRFDAQRGSAIGWVLAIARNAAIDIGRRRAAQATGEAPDVADPGAAPDERVASAETAFRVHAAVEQLGPPERSVIELAYFSGLSQSEIAERLEIPLGTVKTRTRRALRQLADELGEAP